MQGLVREPGQALVMAREPEREMVQVQVQVQEREMVLALVLEPVRACPLMNRHCRRRR